MSIPWLTINETGEGQDPTRPLHEFFDTQGHLDVRQLQDPAESLKKDAHPVLVGTPAPIKTLTRGPKHVFERGITFIGITFACPVEISSIESHGPVIFWGCTFLSTFDMSNAEVKCSNEIIHRDAGEVNFSYCVFDERANFERAVFNGNSYFHRTVFKKGVDFSSTKFNKPVVFEGFESDICMPISNLRQAIRDEVLPAEQAMNELSIPLVQADATAEHMLQRMLADDEQILIPCRDFGAYVNFNLGLNSVEGLRRKLQRAFQSPGDEEAQRSGFHRAFDAIEREWKSRFDRSMFSHSFRKSGSRDDAKPDFEVEITDDTAKLLTSFRGATFAAGSSFRHVKLNHCLFRGSNVACVDFVVCEWAQMKCNPAINDLAPIFFWARRQAVRDELENDRLSKQPDRGLTEIIGRRKELSELYRELRIAYDKEGDTVASRDFYFGELEMQRLTKPRSKRVLSASFAFKLLAGYSKQEGLALFWLLLLTLLIFPLLYFVLSGTEHWLLYEASVRNGREQAAVAKQVNGVQKAQVVDALRAAADAQLVSEANSKKISLAKSAQASADVAVALADAAANASGLPALVPTNAGAERSPGAGSEVLTDMGMKDDSATPEQKLAVSNAKAGDLKSADETIWGSTLPQKVTDKLLDGKSGGLALALSSSLRASTFLSSLPESNAVSNATAVVGGKSLLFYEAVRRILAATERLIVLAQITLLYGCLRARFRKGS